MNLNELEVMARAAKERPTLDTMIEEHEAKRKEYDSRCCVMVWDDAYTAGLTAAKEVAKDVPALADAVLALVARVRLLENALKEICTLGRVCDSYEMCNHPACVDSAGAYLIALDTLKKAEAGSEGHGNSEG